jgi:2-methylcitrate dehydratase PrpD
MPQRPAEASKSVNEKIAAFVAEAKYEDLPAEVIRKAKEQIVFFFGRAFEGSFSEEAKKMRLVANRGGLAKGRSRVIGERLRLTPPDAAFANCSLMRGSQRDDVIWPAGIHAGVVTLPTALAIGEAERVTGRELLLALVLGYEVLGKLGRAADGWEAPLPRRPTNIYGGYGPITVAGRLLKLDRQHMANALGYAANLGMGIPEGGMMDHYYSLISGNATLAAQLAQSGGAPYSNTTIEGDTGLYRSFFGRVPADLPKLIDALGSQWEILTAEQKRHPGTGQNAIAIELLLELIKKHKLTPDKVVRIDAVQPSVNDAAARKDAVASRGPFKRPVEAYSSLPYALALMLLFNGSIGLQWYSDEATETVFNDRAVAAAMQKVNLTFEAGHGPRWCRLVVHMADGRKLVREVENMDFPLPPAVWGEWLQQDGKRLLPLRQLHRLERLITHLEDVNDVSALMDAVVPQNAGSRA